MRIETPFPPDSAILQPGRNRHFPVFNRLPSILFCSTAQFWPLLHRAKPPFASSPAKAFRFTVTLRHSFHIIASISNCCYFQNAVLIATTDRISATVYRIEYEWMGAISQYQIKTYHPFQLNPWTKPIPSRLLSLSISILLILKASLNVWKVPFSDVREFNLPLPEIPPGQELEFGLFDDLFVIVDTCDR
jgi:hypothetical protein